MMEDFNKSVTYAFNKELKRDEMRDLQASLNKVEGIISADVTSARILVEYDALLLATGAIRETLSDLGYPVKEPLKKKNGMLSRFITNLADSNRETYGNKRLDCCDLKHH